MKTRLNKKSYLLLTILTIFVFGSFMAFGKATTDDITINIDEFKEVIENSLNDSWKKPAQNRKNTICNKLTELQQLIIEEQFEEAYNKLLHDIKPKLTGLKQNEHGEPWGNGVYEKAWVTCNELRVTFEEECNLILSQIYPFSVEDDDKTPPSISIQYEGEGHVANPGVWHVSIEDLDSGLDTVVIIVNEIEEFYDLQGDHSASYDVPVPAIAQINMIEVIATNDDKDYVGDQETSAESDWVEIFADITPPTIVPPEDVEYEYGSIGNTLTWVISDEYPNNYEIFIDGVSFESEVWKSGVPITLNVDGFAVGTYEFMISCYDIYNNIATDNVLVNVIEDDDTTPPSIVIYYDGGSTTANPGHWIVVIEDSESGIDEVYVLIDGDAEVYDISGDIFIMLEVNVPGTVGDHTIEVTAINNDKDWIGDQESHTESDEVRIVFIPPIPLP